MARLIQAFSKYGPKIDLMEAADPRRFMDLITRRTRFTRACVKDNRKAKWKR